MNITTMVSIALVGQLGSPLVIKVGDQVPKLNVEASCQTTVPVSTNMTQQQAYDICISDEKEALQQLASKWSSAPGSVRDQCEAEATIAGYASYVDLLTCMEMSTDWQAASSPKTALRGASKKRNQN